MDIKTLFEEALLAQVTYVDDLKPGMKGIELISALTKDNDNDITQAQAEYFASKYQVVEQTENIETGFSATLFQEIKEDGTLGEYHLATRGTSSLSPTDPDWHDANLDNSLYGMAYEQVTDLINFYLRLTAPINDPNTNTINAAQQFKFKEVPFEPFTPIREAA